MQQMIQPAVCSIVVLIVLCLSLPSPAQEEAGNAEQQKKEQLRRDARAHVETFSITGESGERYEPVEEPLLSSTDLSRGESGSLWVFGTEGRPIAVLELFTNTGAGDPRWIQVLTLTSSRLVTARVPPDFAWLPRQSQLELAPLPEAPPPAGRTNLRERQAKLLARRFDAHEFWDPNNSRFELRLLQTPLHRYQDEAAGVQDGMLFAFVHGTNPEVLLLLEAHPKGEGGAEWRYGLIRMGSAELHVSLDGEEVWHVGRTPGVAGTPRDPYWISAAPAGAE